MSGIVWVCHMVHHEVPSLWGPEVSRVDIGSSGDFLGRNFSQWYPSTPTPSFVLLPRDMPGHSWVEVAEHLWLWWAGGLLPLLVLSPVQGCCQGHARLLRCFENFRGCLGGYLPTHSPPFPEHRV
jgi:hypothetical protein